MSRHTPGPWSNPDNLDIQADHKAICHMAEGNRSRVADARLIAAAPDLMAACQAALAQDDEDLAGFKETLQKVAEAIAKAEEG
jgi:predicted DNA-binding protein